MLSYLISVCTSPGSTLSYTSISCGSWLDWALDPKKSGNFLGIDVKAKTAIIYDSGKMKFAVTTSRNTGLAVARALINPEITKNKQVFLCDFTTTTREIVGELEKQTGVEFRTEQKNSETAIATLREAFDQGDFSAAFPLLAISFGADVDVGYDFEKEQEVWNSKLQLPAVTLEEVIRAAIGLAKRD